MKRIYDSGNYRPIIVYLIYFKEYRYGNWDTESYGNTCTNNFRAQFAVLNTNMTRDFRFLFMLNTDQLALRVAFLDASKALYLYYSHLEGSSTSVGRPGNCQTPVIAIENVDIRQRIIFDVSPDGVHVT